jgi:NADP-dependent 3-hydroxy acid dehydrogenase YdfG
VKNEYPTYASARRIESIEHLKKIGCETLQIDVTSYDSIDKAVKTIEKKHSSVGILINNAANGIMGAMETIPLEDVKRLYETNVFGLLAMTQAVLPKMRKAGKGRIVNIGSSGGEFSFLLGSSKVIIKTTLPPHQILSYQCSPKTLQHPHQPEKNASVA